MNKIVVQAGYMSGDMFGTAAALKLETNLYVLLVHDAQDKGEAEKMMQLYLSTLQNMSRDSGPIPQRARPENKGPVKSTRPPLLMQSNRVKLLAVPNSRLFYKAINNYKDPNHATAADTAKRQFASSVTGHCKFEAMGYTTDRVVYHFGSKNADDRVRRALIQQWEIHDFDELAIQRFLIKKGITHGKSYLFLWIRLSGKQGGAHTELDSSRHSWQQLLDATPADIQPVLIGDSFGKPLNNPRGPLPNLTRFWNEPPFSLYKNERFVGAEARLAQFTLFDYMQRAGYKVCHLGMRSGVLESAALMGAPTLYMEEMNNPQGKRIAALAASMDNYDRLQLEQLPTRRGKVIDANQQQEWYALYGTRIQKITNHCKESADRKKAFSDMTARITAVEKAVSLGKPFTDYMAEFVRLSAPGWRTLGFGDASNWALYKNVNYQTRKWCNDLEAMLRDLYTQTWDKAGVSKGFKDTDVTKIIAAVQKKIAERTTLLESTP